MTISQFDAAQDIRLVGASWSLAMLQGAPVMPDSTITARFDTDGAVSGSGGEAAALPAMASRLQ